MGRALRAGPRLILGGRRFRPSGLPGHFFQPTILGNVPAGSANEEILGPVITLTPVGRCCQRARAFGPRGQPARAWIYTGDPEALGSSLQARSGGTFFINDPGEPSAGPFGGLRPGRLLGALAAPPAREPHSGIVRAGVAIEPKPWWFPYLERKS